MEPESLQNLGSSKNESQVYLALLKLGSASVNEIARHADVHRVNIYDTLERLHQKGLISSIMKSNKKYFEVANPKEKLNELIDKKEKEISFVKKSLPEMISVYQDSANKQNAHIFKGSLGIKSVLKDILSSKPKEILDIGASKSGLPYLLPDYFKIWDSQRIKSKIKIKIITSSKLPKKLKNRRLQEIKFVNQEFEASSSTLIYNDKVAIFMWIESPIAILIESKELANSYKNYFNLLWEKKN